MLLQRRLVYYPNIGWYATPIRLVHYSNESTELPMTYRLVMDNSTMTEVCRSTEEMVMIVPRGISSSLRGSVKFFESDYV
jgi:hypothetical protein